MTRSWSSKRWNATFTKGCPQRKRLSRRCKRSLVRLLGLPWYWRSVFVPTAFVPGITGRLYQQFAVTIAVSVLLSAFNALTLSPALCAISCVPGRANRAVAKIL